MQIVYEALCTRFRNLLVLNWGTIANLYRTVLQLKKHSNFGPDTIHPSKLWSLTPHAETGILNCCL